MFTEKAQALVQLAKDFAFSAGTMELNILSLFMGILGAGGSYLANTIANNGAKETATKEATKKPATKDIGSCLAAATAAMQAFSKYKSMQNQEDAAEQNLEEALKIQNAPPPQINFTAAAMSGARSSGAGGSTGKTGGGFAQGEAQNPGPDSGSCNKNMGAAGMVQCAAARDRNLPAFVASPRFADEFKKTSKS